MKKLLTLLIILTIQSASAKPNGIAKAHALTGSGNVGMSTPTMCEYYAEVTNNSKHPIEVYVNYIFNPDGQKYEGHRYKIKVGDGKWHDTYKIQRDFIYKREGNYNLKCQTIIENIATFEDNSTIYVR